jgi:hypothetical protein
MRRCAFPLSERLRVYPIIINVLDAARNGLAQVLAGKNVMMRG